MSDTFTEVSSEGWLSRLMGSIKGVLVGLLLFVIGFPMLWWNEGRAVTTYNSLKEGSGAVVSVEVATVDPANEGKLVHLSGEAASTATLEDKTFGVVVTNGLRLKRMVEIYRWEEKSKSKSEKKLGGGKKTTKTYTYKTDWGSVSSIPNSSNFKKPNGHQNPSKGAFSDKSSQADKVTFGGFMLSTSQVGRLSNWTSLQLGQAEYDKLPNIMKRKVQLADSYFYYGANPNSPAVGDLRITFKAIKPHTISVIAKQTGKSFTGYKTQAGDTLSMLSQGTVSAKDMFSAAQSANTMMTWILRFVGFLLMFIGVKMIFEPLVVVADVIPFLGNVLSYGTGLFAFAIAGFFSFITIAMAWFAYRPLLSIFLIAIAIGCVVLAKKMAGGGGGGPPPIKAPPPVPGGDGGGAPPPIPGA